MTNTRDIIIKLKEVRDQKGLSYAAILKLMEKNNDFVSKSTLSRVFADGSEDLSFKYEETIRPIANALLDMENIEDDDDMDVRAIKTILKYKIQRIEELELEVERLKGDLAKEKVKYHEKLEKERDRHNKSVEFLKEQISLKDKRMDQLLEAVFKKDQQMSQMNERFLTCQLCKEKNK